ncbi:MAG: hypothetical protein JZU60_02145 [Ilumatobacteraceae bacterium]|jgi:hypothetical protein|nr:hypothetical protein [Ilumatobacteraceae bacterium]
MDLIKTSTGNKEISVERDGKLAGVVRFNPSDVVFAEKFYALVGEFESKLAEYQTRSEAIESQTELDNNQLPVNMEDRLALLREACTFIRERIDHLFGTGTSQIAFGDTLSLDIFTQFFEGITPFIQAVRIEKIAQYSVKGQRTGKRVMK